MLPTRSRRLLVTTTLALSVIVSSTACGSSAASPSAGATVPAGVEATDAGPLSHWTAALKDQDQHAATWLALGDSITEGQGASTRDSRWIDQTVAGLRTGGAGGEGYVPGWYSVWGPDSTWTASTARTGTIKDDSAGSLGLRTAVLSAGASQTYTITGTSADLYYSAGGVLAYSVDGGPATQLDTAQASGAGRTHVDLVASGDHTLEVSAVSGTVRLAGVAGFDGDESTGVHLFDGAHSGYTLGQFVAAEAEQDPFVELVQPDLVTIELGVNDYLKGETTPEQLGADLTGLVADLRSGLETDPSIVLVLPYEIGPVSDGPARSWDDYAAAVRALGPELSVGVLDMSSMGTATPGGTWSADGLHPSDAGHAEMARRATAYLAPTG